MTVAARRGDWMQLASGQPFWPLDPRPEEIHIEDIAAALSKLCRYGGHCKRFYCPTPDQRILTADLRWVPAGDLKVGNELLGFDEHPTEVGSTGKNRRRFRHAVVLEHMPVRRHIIRLELADGSTVRASAEHPWLVATKVSRNQKWLTSQQIVDDLTLGRKRYLHKFIEPWKELPSRDAGWLSGIYDGEGHLSVVDRRGMCLGVAQRPGLVLDEIKRLLNVFGFDAGWSQRPCGDRDVLSIQMKGGWRGAVTLLGQLRPIRLVNKFANFLRNGDFAKQMDGVAEPLEIIRAYIERDEWVSGIETSTHTYLCEGFAAHNSVAEHCVLMANAAPTEFALAALMHDASEAYLSDVIRPIKAHLVNYKAVEAALEAAIALRFSLAHPLSPDVKALDERIIADERDQAMLPAPMAWSQWTVVPPLGVTLQFWAPEKAEFEFLAAFRRYGGHWA